MKRYFLKLLIVLLPTLGIAQFDYSLDFVSGVDLNMGQVSLGTSELKPQINFRVGGNFNVKAFENIYLKTGLRYVEISTKVSNNGLRFPSNITSNGFEVDPNVFNSVPLPPLHFESSMHRRYIEFPVILRIQVGKNKLSGYFEAGVSPHYYLNTTSKRFTVLSDDTETINETERGGRRIRYAIVFGFGINYKFSDRFQLFLQPNIRKYTEAIPTAAIVEDLLNIGLEFGVRHGFYFQKSVNIEAETSDHSK